MDTIAIEKQARHERAVFLRALAGKLWSAWKARAERREAAEYLYRLTDYELADIGLTRTDIPAAVAGRMFTDRAHAHFVGADTVVHANDDTSVKIARAA